MSTLVTKRPLMALSLLILVGCNNPEPTTEQPTTEPPTKQPSRMHPSWDRDGDGVNDCEREDSCDHTIDYSLPRPDSN